MRVLPPCTCSQAHTTSLLLILRAAAMTVAMVAAVVVAVVLVVKKKTTPVWACMGLACRLLLLQRRLA